MNKKPASYFICIFIALLSLSVFFSACTREEGKPVVDKNVIKDYVRNPLNKAEDVKNKLEGKQDAMRKQAGLLEGE